MARRPRLTPANEEALARLIARDLYEKRVPTEKGEWERHVNEAVREYLERKVVAKGG
jgi:hypothetical protein